MLNANQVVEFVEAFKTSSLLVPTYTPTSLISPTTTAHATSSVAPIPTVTPNHPIVEKVGETGTKTLWVRSSDLHHVSKY
jgi:hypothetical protein